MNNFIETWKRPYSPGVLSREELQQFWELGYVIKHDLLSKSTLERVKTAVERLVEKLATELHEAGKVADTCAKANLYTRLTLLEKQYPAASILLHKQGVLPPEIASLWSCPELLSAAKQLLGDTVGGHPVWNLRCKTPQNEESTVPWHQDNAYLDPESWQCLQVTAWIPLLDANYGNGCMQVLRGGHRTGKTARHTCCVGGTWYVQMDEASAASQLEVDMTRDCVTCEVPFGGVLFLNNIIPHRSLNNLSREIRWSLDLRFQRLDEPNGFYGLKPCIPLLKEDNSGYQVDWTTWSTVDRNLMQANAVSKSKREQLASLSPVEELDTTISGPWFDNWELVNHNRHTAKYFATKGCNAHTWTFA